MLVTGADLPPLPGDVRRSSVLAEIEDFLEGFNQPTYRGMWINGVRVHTWSSEHGWSGM